MRGTNNSKRKSGITRRKITPWWNDDVSGSEREKTKITRMGKKQTTNRRIQNSQKTY
jgi:hypothetical protein